MGNIYMESTQINYRRDDKLKTVDQKLQELSETSAIDTDIAPVFKSTNTYQPGDMVYYRNKLYVFNVEHTGAWAAADVTATDVTTEISSLESGLTNVQDDVKLNTQDLTTPSRSKNLLPLTLTNLKARNTTGTWSGNVYTCPNVAFTVNTNDDGLVTSISTTSSGSYSDTMALEFKLPKGTYKLTSGFTETSGSTDTILFKDNVVIARGNSASPGQTFTLASDSTVVWNIRATSSDITAYPMIRPATITDATYTPYIPSVESRIEAVENKMKTDTFSGTTDAYGNINLNNYRYVLTAYAGGYICIPFEYNYNRYIKVLSTTTFEQVANTNVSGAYTYIDS